MGRQTHASSHPSRITCHRQNKKLHYNRHITTAFIHKKSHQKPNFMSVHKVHAHDLHNIVVHMPHQRYDVRQICS
jgi:hypothetical protein